MSRRWSFEAMRSRSLRTYGGASPAMSSRPCRASHFRREERSPTFRVRPQGLQTVALASRDGKLQRLDLPPQSHWFPRVSPDGQQLAIQTEDGTEAFISIYNLKGAGPARRLTFDGRDRFPLWTPDGRRITFQSDREGDRGIFWQLADGTGPPERLTKKPDSLVTELRPDAWSPDGKTLALSVTPPLQWRIFTWATGGAQALQPFSAFPARFSAFSPDGKWLAYSSIESGNRFEISSSHFRPPARNTRFQLKAAAPRCGHPTGGSCTITTWANASSPSMFGRSQSSAAGSPSRCRSKRISSPGSIGITTSCPTASNSSSLHPPARQRRPTRRPPSRSTWC